MEDYVYLGGSSAVAMAAAGDLEGVARVYEHVESLVRCAGAEQVEEELEASVALLDACAAARDGLRAMRASALDLEVAVRRGDGGRARDAARAYALLARKARTEVVIKTQRRRRRRPSQVSTDGAGGLEEARRVTAAVLERVVAALSRRAVAVPSAPAGSPSKCCWSACIVARAFMRKRTRVAACEDGAATEEETTTALVPCSKESSSSPATASWRATTQRELRALGETIGHLEDGLELLFRRLVQCRAFLLDTCSA